MAKNPIYHKRSKHIDVRLNLIRDIIEGNVFSIKKIATPDNPVDMLTNPLLTEKFKHSLDLMNVRIAKGPLGAWMRKSCVWRIAK